MQAELQVASFHKSEISSIKNSDRKVCYQVTDAELEELYVETNFYSLLSHLFWAVWAIVQVQMSYNVKKSFAHLSYLV